MYGCALLLGGTFVFNCVDPSDDFIQDKMPSLRGVKQSSQVWNSLANSFLGPNPFMNIYSSFIP